MVEQGAYRETSEHREKLFHQQSICLAVDAEKNPVLFGHLIINEMHGMIFLIFTYNNNYMDRPIAFGG